MLELRGLTRRFGDIVALEDLTFNVPRGRVLGFLGPNGAGKTTAMRAVMGISVPDRGTVTWDGQPLDGELRKRFGYMPEERGLYSTMVVRDQLVYLGRLHGMSKAAAGDAASHWLTRLGVKDRAGDKLEALSLGNQQRVQLAAALVHAPELLILDEPFSGLDPVGIDALAGVLGEQAAAGAAVIFSSHQLDLVEDLCQDVAIINRGHLVAAGAVAELTRPDGRHIAVEVAGAPDGWLDDLVGLTIERRARDGRVHLLLDEGVDPDVVVDAAQRAGRLRHFSLEHRALSDVFRDAVRSSDLIPEPSP